MTRRLSPAERLASAEKDLLLEELADQSSWDRFLVEQAVYHFGTRHNEFSANDLRDVLPELAHGFLGAAINSLRTAGVIEHTGRVVPSTLASTHGHRLGVWRLSVKGLAIAEQRRIRHQQPQAAA
ncbi:hypothetical protein [Streptomyces filamentosus]|uniref:hypothetical protein n=1 Tax=Streptomyces filamentosus TaxID=67294 RepID=UPI0012398C1A|nr:hypothetical protein [Streptomyces filamentosus]KAA6216444.1 hypothetical protein CP979_05395 [Streptomyces filamentosus]